ncbi:hypothetical protein ACFWJW_03510 [Streptomyces sp. NPDC127097]|uniref:hypothetical protein n=1 Tax=Streptomyces sp. NPDC127097 TaxID=3347136 RepID=UPI00364F96BF
MRTAPCAVREDERDGYAQRLEELLRAYGPGSKPASHGRYMLVGQPENLIVCERMESAPSLLRGRGGRPCTATRLSSTAGPYANVWQPGHPGSRTRRSRSTQVTAKLARQESRTLPAAGRDAPATEGSEGCVGRQSEDQAKPSTGPATCHNACC